MIKARAGNAIVLGLSKINLDRLKEGKPIAFDGKEIGIPNRRIFIMYGETELEIIHELEEVTGNGKTHSLS